MEPVLSGIARDLHAALVSHNYMYRRMALRMRQVGVLQAAWRLLAMSQLISKGD